MIYEKVTITDRHVVVSYSGDALSLTPEIEAELRAYWAARIERITRLHFGLPERDDSGAFASYVPEREHLAPRKRVYGALFPDGNIT